MRLERRGNQNRGDLFIAAIVGVCAFFIFWYSPVRQFTDSYYSLLVSQSLIDHRSFALDHYNIPRLPREYHDHTWKNGHIHQLEVVGEHFYYYMPPGSAVLSVPFVAVANLTGISPRNPDGTYNPIAERRIQTSLAALLMAAFAVTTFLIARLLLPVKWSLIVSCGAALGTQVWSTTSRGLWADTWGILLLGLVVYSLLADAVGKRKVNPIVLASLLSWCYFVRPSNAAVVVAVTCYILIKRRDMFVRYALTGAAWLALFVWYSWIHYHAFLPTYFRVNQRLTFTHYPIAIAGNLISPSRGLFIFVPVTLFVLFLAWRLHRTVVSQPLLYLATAVLVVYVLVVSTFDPWWAGASFGPRYLAPLVPWLVLLGVLGLDALRRNPAPVFRRRAIYVGCLFLIVSVSINAVGAFSRTTWLWNGQGDINHDSHKVWSIRHPQLLSAFVNPPLPKHFPLLPERIDLATNEAEKYLASGWSGPENGFRWTDGSKATIVFGVDQPRDLTMEISLTPFLVTGKHNQQRMDIVLNDKPIKTLAFDAAQTGVYQIRLPRELISERNVLEFRLPDAASPFDFQLSADERRLGVAVQWIRFVETARLLGRARTRGAAQIKNPRLRRGEATASHPAAKPFLRSLRLLSQGRSTIGRHLNG